jgi:hypothetical protein
MIFLQRLNKVPTSAFIWGGLIAACGAMVLDQVNGPIFRHLPALNIASEFLSLAMFWLSFYGLLILIPISLFRPASKFSMHGDCARRAMNFFLCIASVILVLAALGFLIARGIY